MKGLGEKLLVGVIVLLLVANLWMLGQSLGLHFHKPKPKSFLEALNEELWKKYLKEDPILGTEIAELKPFKGRRLVIVIKRCTDCVAQSLKVLDEVIKREGLPKLVLVTGDRREEAEQVLKRFRIDAELVTDPKGKIAKKLHAFFTPRAYGFENGKLVWKQERFGLKPFEMVREAMKK